jgi:nucleoside-diphosphate-sugar epimerase
MAAESVLIVGCGDVGIATARLLVERGYRVAGLRRNTGELPAFIEPLAADICNPASLAVLQQRHFSWVLVTTSAGGFSQELYRAVYVDGLRNVLQRLEMQMPKGLLLASSTSVYHQQDGSWVDETSATEPSSFAGRIQLEAEALTLASKIPSSVVRFAGIYGPGRERLLSRLRQGYIVASDSQNYSNRIHSRDCAGILAHLLAMRQGGVATESHYLAVDCAPTPLRAVCEWLASAIGLDPATLQEDATPMRGGNKRCSNRRLLQTGYRFVYPDYQSGFGSILQAGLNQAP